MKPAAFKDHFSAHASAYARYRPRYPEALFAYLASLCPAHDLAHPAVEQPRDVLVAQPCQNLPFGEKAPFDGLGVPASANELEGDLFLESAVGSFGQKDLAHAAVAEFVGQHVGADAAASERFVVRGLTRVVE